MRKQLIVIKKVFILGNGGSASVSNYYVCDFNKNLNQLKNKKRLNLSSYKLIETITAIANDISFDQIFLNN